MLEIKWVVICWWHHCWGHRVSSVAVACEAFEVPYHFPLTLFVSVVLCLWAFVIQHLVCYSVTSKSRVSNGESQVTSRWCKVEVRVLVRSEGFVCVILRVPVSPVSGRRSAHWRYHSSSSNNIRSSHNSSSNSSNSSTTKIRSSNCILVLSWAESPRPSHPTYWRRVA